MALTIWSQPSGYNLGTFPEKQTVDIVLPLVQGPAFNGIPPLSYDGTGHHPNFPLRNSAGSSFTRYPVNSYVDGIHQMRSDLPNARTVSNLVVWDHVNGGDTPDPTGYSGFMYAWGQFVTHDLASERTGGANIDVIVPVGDTNLTPGSHIPVTRAQVAPGTGTNGIVATFINDVTGWIDGSVIYGIAYPPGVVPASGFANPISLREGGSTATTGKLLTSSNGQYPAIVNNNFLLGDPRGTENPDLTSVQTLMVREHNWHATRLAQLHPDWTGEQIYQRARSIVIAEEQVITYNEWLPKVVGATAIPAYTGFKPDTDASIKIEFDAAALRFGHSIVSGAQDRVDEFGNITESVTLGQAFFLTPAEFERNGGADGFLRKLASDISNKLDVYIIEDLRNLLNDPPAAMDLAATNIQRGRDLGLPSLNQMRTALGLLPYTSFSQITSDTTIATALQTAYTNIDNIDLWVGGLAEDRVLGAMVGSTFQAILVDQFIRTRDGDNQWFENIPWPPEELAWIKGTTLADIILRNTDTVRMQADAFVAVERADLYNDTVNTITARSFPNTITLSPTVTPTFKVISGKLPPGLSINGSNITGTPYEVVRTTTFEFCVRASLANQFSDRTLNITIQNTDGPVYITPAGELNIGPDQQYFLQDKTYVDFQIEVFDGNVAAGAKLNFFIDKNGGQLPPGLSLTDDGRITGFVLPALSILPTSGDGSFDNSYYDSFAYDFGLLSSNGFDSYNYDDVFYDYNLSQTVPRQLNRTYQFIISVTDGNVLAKRTFQIFVVGDDFLKADNTVIRDGTSLFTADVTYLRAPVWSSPSNLGTYRADNYLTVLLKTYDVESILFTLELVNARIQATISQVLLTDNKLLGSSVTIFQTSTAPIMGQYFTLTDRVPGATSLLYRITNVSSIGNGYYRLTVNHPLEVDVPNDTVILIGDLCQLPPGLAFDENYNELAGRVPYQPAITRYYNFTITAKRVSPKYEVARSSRLFTLGIIGEVDSTISWNTPANLGTISANFISNLAVSASTNVPSAQLVYTLVGGSLPAGLTLDGDGEISGKANQFKNTTTNALGLTTFDLTWNPAHNITTPTTFDSGTTTVDHVYKFTVQAQDQFGYSAITRTFVLTVGTPNQVTFSNIRVQPYLKLSQRALFKEFINNTSIFTPNNIYRLNDPNFGLQTNLSMIVYAGIQTEAAAAYISAINLNHKKKQFYFGSIKKATAFIPGTKTPVYEILYVEMQDPLEPNGKRLASSLSRQSLSNTIISADNSGAYFTRLGGAAGPNDPSITIDSTAYQVSNKQANKYYPNSISNWRDRIANTTDHFDANGKPIAGVSERDYLPLWMRSIQPGSYEELGFTLAIPLVYCKVGTADQILLNIKNLSTFDFKQLNYTADRYIIDSVLGQTGDKYLVFRNDRITV